MSMKMIRLPTAARHAFLALLLMGVMLSFGAGYAYSGLKSAHKDMIRVAYTNGYKDALEHTFQLEQGEISKLKSDYAFMKKHVISASQSYIDKVVALNYAK